jgi:hypothetical protein
MRNWSSASSVKCTAKSTASHSFAALLRRSLTMGLKQLVQAARVVQRVVYGFEQLLITIVID